MKKLFFTSILSCILCHSPAMLSCVHECDLSGVYPDSTYKNLGSLDSNGHPNLFTKSGYKYDGCNNVACAGVYYWTGCTQQGPITLYTSVPASDITCTNSPTTIN